MKLGRRGVALPSGPIAGIGQHQGEPSGKDAHEKAEQENHLDHRPGGGLSRRAVPAAVPNGERVVELDAPVESHHELRRVGGGHG